jgi:hypothetical protein
METGVRELAGAAHLHEDVLHLGDAAARRPLVGQGPARGPPGEAQLLPQAGVVHLDDHAIDLEGQGVALLLPVGDEILDLVEVLAQAPGAVDLEAGLGERLQGARMLLEGDAAAHREEVGVEVEAALGGDGGVEHAHASGGGVARVGEAGEPGGLALLVQPLEGLGGHDDFAAHLELRRQPRFFQRRRRDGERHGADGAHVGGDLLAHLAVAAGQSQGQLRLALLLRVGLVAQGHGEAVQLEFADAGDFLVPAEFVDAALPVAQFLRGVGVVQREHGGGVRQLDEALARRAAHALGRRVGGDQAGMLGLQALQLLHQAVEVGVGDLGGVEHKVEVFVAADLVAQGRDAALDVLPLGGRGHAKDYRGEGGAAAAVEGGGKAQNLL